MKFAISILIGGWLILTPLTSFAGEIDLTLLPGGGTIAGSAGSTIGWGYSITNNTSDWIQTENVSGGVFTIADPSTPGFIFDYPEVAPFSTVTEAFTAVNTGDCLAAPCGLFELVISSSASPGAFDAGDFIVSTDFYDAEPDNGGNDIGAAPDASASYEADVTGSGTPEPATWLLLLSALLGLVVVRRRAAAPALLALLAVTPAVRAANYTVNTTTDVSLGTAQCSTAAEPCSLRGAVTLAQGAAGSSIIQVPAGTYALTQTGYCGFESTALCVNSAVNLSIVGAGAASTTVDGGKTGQIFLLQNGSSNIQISGLTLTNADNSTSEDLGGAIYNVGALTVTNCVFTGNSANDGAGIYNAQFSTAVLSVFDTTFSYNSASGSGAAIMTLGGGAVTIVNSTFVGNYDLSCCGVVSNENGYGGGAMTITGSTFTGNSGNETLFTAQYTTLTVTNSTLSGNTSTGYAAGIDAGDTGVVVSLYGDTITGNTSSYAAGGFYGTAAMANTIIAGNSSTQTPTDPDCVGSVVSLGYNLIQNVTGCTITGVTTGNILGQSATLGAVASNGGPTQTAAPQPGSPAIGAGNPALPGSGSGACTSTDQRGITRKASSRCDIGAFQTGGALAVTAITPTAASNSGVAIAVVSGNDFSPSATVKLSRNGQPDIPGNPITVDPGEAELSAAFNVAGQATGAWDVMVTNPDATTVTLVGGFQVQSSQTPVITTDLNAPPLARPGFQMPVQVVIHNQSNTDAYGVVFGILVKNGFTVTPTFTVLAPPYQTGQVQADWTSYPLVVDQTQPLNVYPFMLPFVPAGYTGALPFNIFIPANLEHGTPFSIVEGNDSPYFDPGFDPAASASLVSGAQAIALADGGAIAPSATSSMLTYLSNQYNLAIQSAASSLVASGSATLPAYSLTQLQFDLAQYGVSLPGSTAAPAAMAVNASRETVRSLRLRPRNCGAGEPCLPDPPPDLDPSPPPCAGTGPSFQQKASAFFSGVPGCTPQCTGNCSSPNPLTSGSADPNFKTGPRGATASQFVTGVSPLDYVVGFSNEPTAGLPAQTVMVTDQLDTTRVDPTTFSLGTITVAALSVTPPPGTQQYSTTIDLRPNNNILVRVDAGINNAGLITWNFTSLDPNTLQFTTNGLAGFLPPDTNPPNGEAQVLYTVSSRPTLSTGTAVTNQASVVFDANPAMITPVWTNLIDTTAPHSSVTALVPSQTTVTFPVQWSGADAGSGIVNYSIFVSQNGGGYTPWLTRTALTTSNFTGQPGQAYAFYSTAQDAVGNTEAAHLTADTSTSVALGTPRITATVSDTGTSGGSFYVDLLVTESGTAAVTNVALSQITARTLTGSGTVIFNAALSGALPLSAGNLAVGGSKMVRLYFTVPAGVTRFSLTENGSLQVTSGSPATFSASQVVIL